MTSDKEIPDSLWVTASSGQYPVFISHTLLDNPACFQSFIDGKQVFILSSPQIAAHHLPLLENTCVQAGALQIDHFLISAGEQHKTLDEAQKIWDALLQRHHYRDTVIIALGGGMVGDLAGFCAACYLRGVTVIQCPTSLVAQIDAAIGGKTAVNLPQGKNLIGAFYPPAAVMTDLRTLATLPQREYISGLGELIKYGLALDADFFNWIEQHIDQIVNREPTILHQAVRWACQIKAHVVSIDERDSAQRIVLNFGHTLAHALESILDYQYLLHGEAVALGMLVAIHLSLQQNNSHVELLSRSITLFERAGLPTQLPPGVTVSAILAKMKQDKKHTHKALLWVLLKGLGQAHVSDAVIPEHIMTALKVFTSM